VGVLSIAIVHDADVGGFLVIIDVDVDDAVRRRRSRRFHEWQCKGLQSGQDVVVVVVVVAVFCLVVLAILASSTRQRRRSRHDAMSIIILGRRPIAGENGSGLAGAIAIAIAIARTGGAEKGAGTVGTRQSGGIRRQRG